MIVSVAYRMPSHGVGQEKWQDSHHHTTPDLADLSTATQLSDTLTKKIEWLAPLAAKTSSSWVALRDISYGRFAARLVRLVLGKFSLTLSSGRLLTCPDAFCTFFFFAILVAV